MLAKILLANAKTRALLNAKVNKMGLVRLCVFFLIYVIIYISTPYFFKSTNINSDYFKGCFFVINFEKDSPDIVFYEKSNEIKYLELIPKKRQDTVWFGSRSKKVSYSYNGKTVKATYLNHFNETTVKYLVGENGVAPVSCFKTPVYFHIFYFYLTLFLYIGIIEKRLLDLESH